VPTVIHAAKDLLDLDGGPLGTSAWHEVTQDEVDHFAEGTGNRAPIHSDPEFARTTPLGGTIAFGIQILAMATMLLSDIWELRGVVDGVDYGANRVRYPAPVRVGERIRLHATVAKAELAGEQGVRVTLDLVFELDGSERPACAAEIVFIYFFGSD
jgi:acyl dehydratase